MILKISLYSYSYLPAETRLHSINPSQAFSPLPVHLYSHLYFFPLNSSKILAFYVESSTLTLAIVMFPVLFPIPLILYDQSADT